MILVTPDPAPRSPEAVIIELIDVVMSKNEWFSLDGVSFRAGA